LSCPGLHGCMVWSFQVATAGWEVQG
jgi:hypothetical protein